MKLSSVGENMPEFQEFPKIARLSRRILVSEKLDGTNATVYIGEDGQMLFGSRTRWIAPGDDNYGFARWATEHADELRELGPGWHRGEWWGCGIQRGYGLKEKRFSLFNTDRWGESRPGCCGVVPVLYDGIFSTAACNTALDGLAAEGSAAAPGWRSPEGIVIFHTAANLSFKKTLLKDEMSKGETERSAAVQR